MIKPIVKYNPQEETGNIYVILGKARKALQINRRYKQADEMAKRALSSSDYKEALSIIGEYVKLVEEKR